IDLGHIYKQINAPVGALGLASLKISTAALASNAAHDSTYTSLESALSAITARRDELARRMSTLMEQAEFYGQPIDVAVAERLIAQGNALLAQVIVLAANV